MAYSHRWIVYVGIALGFAGSGRPAAMAEELPAPKPKAAAKEDQAKEERHKFVRIVRNAKKEPLKLQTAVVTFKKPGKDEGVSVDLIGAVHIGDKSYYEALNEAFGKYDVVLYELVAPAGTRVPKGHKAKNNHIAGAMQNGMKDVLGLDHQLEEIDYTAENMVHADMSPDEFNKSMSDRGESFLGMMFRFIGQNMVHQTQAKKGSKNAEAEMLMALFSKDRDLALKRVLAEQFEDLEQSMAAFNGKDGSTIITERNKVALDKLAAELQASKKHIAIFYGAGHMPDFEERLAANFGMQRTEEKWFDAWDLTAGKQPQEAEK